MKRVQLVCFIFVLTILNATIYPHTVHAVDHAYTTGGTNFVLYDLGNSSVSPNPWITDDEPGSAKHVLGAYDHNPTQVRSLLQAMCNAGQRKLGLVLPFYVYDQSWGLTDAQKQLTYQSNTAVPPAVLSVHGAPTIRLRTNIQNFMTMVKTLQTATHTICFNEVQFRFSPEGAAHPAGWNSWNESMYQQNWNFIANTRNIVKASSGQTSIFFDLSLEMGGYDQKQTVPYMKRLLADYHSQFGINDTYGYSIAWVSGRFQKLMQTYNEAGIHPSQHAVDIYQEAGAPTISQQLTTLYDEMHQTNQQNTPIIIQETYYNDSQANAAFKTARTQPGIKIRTVMQWQMPRGLQWTTGSSYAYYAPKPGDLNGDNQVNIIDFTLFMSAWFLNNIQRVDLNGDGKKSVIDYTIFMNAWNESR